MKTKDFKELCAAYTANPNLDNENVLLRTMVFDTKFYVATKKYDKGNALRLLQSETGTTVLCVYTHNIDVDSEVKEKYDVTEMSFDDIYENVNVNNVGYILINPSSEALTLTAAQIAKLYREKYYSDFSYPLHLDVETDFKARAMNLTEVNTKTTSKKLIDVYIDSQKEESEEKRLELLNKFLDEFINHAKFYTPVFPTGETDSIGNYVVNKERVVFITEDGIKGKYYLFVDAERIAEYLGAEKEKTYVSVFDFDDYVTMMDAAHGAITGLKIIGDLDLEIPSNDIYHYNAIKVHNELLKDVTVLQGSYAPSEETTEIENDINEYFETIPSVEKVWLGREIEMYKNKKNAFVYNVVLKLKNDEFNKEEVKDTIRRILGNNLFRMYISQENVTDTQLKQVYAASNKPAKKVVKVEEKEETVEKAKTVAKKVPTKKKETAVKKTTTKKVETEAKKTAAKKTSVKKAEIKAKPEIKKEVKKTAAKKPATAKKTEDASKKATTKKVEKK
ncbi:MAG: SseB family protein [Clostridia bacterium]|nr:SseB family protein [Clostridia bacterium]